MLDLMFLGILPYVALVLFFVVSIRRYLKQPFTFSSLSSQFLESQQLFWGSVPFHVGILTLAFGHLVGFLFPHEVMLWNAVPARLFVLEVSALVAGLLTLVGLTGLIWRRFSSSRVRVNTTTMDVVVHVLLVWQVVTGLWVTLGLRWGSAWFPAVAAPYLLSIFKFSPDISRVVGLPLVAKLHIAGAFVLFAIFPYSRLVHILVAPIPYVWRPLQQVIWNRFRGRKLETTP